MSRVSDDETKVAKQDHLRRAMMEKWDPIGVAGIPEAVDEYDAYLDGILNILAARKGNAFLTEYLWALETGHMGLTGDRPRTEYFAAWLDEEF